MSTCQAWKELQRDFSLLLPVLVHCQEVTNHQVLPFLFSKELCKAYLGLDLCLPHCDKNMHVFM
jgi:hypothetical protein